MPTTQIKADWREPMESAPCICPTCRGDCALTGCVPPEAPGGAAYCATLARRARALQAAQEGRK